MDVLHSEEIPAKHIVNRSTKDESIVHVYGACIHRIYPGRIGRRVMSLYFGS